MVESATKAARPEGALGARAASEGAKLDALAQAQLSGALRLVSAEAVSAVERFSDPQLLAAGRINLISLESLQHRLGDRWAAHKEQVFAFADRLLDRHVSNRGVYLRTSDTDLFVVHPDLPRLAGQAACLGYLREILSHFLGKSDAIEGGILQVTRVTNGRLEVSEVDALYAENAIGRGEREPDDGTRLEAYLADDENPSDRINRWAPFVAADGRRLRISATLEPVYELKNFTRIGFRMIRRVIVMSSGEELTDQQASALAAADLLRADVATITRGVDRLTAEAGGEQQLSLIVPISYASLSSQRGRTELAAPLRAAATMVKLGAICELLDIDGVPPSALLSAISVVKPVSLLVVGRVTDATPRSFSRLAGAGLQAVSFECPQGLGDAEFVGWANSTVSAARKAAKSVLVYRAGSMQRAGALAAFGATHVSVLAG